MPKTVIRDTSQLVRDAKGRDFFGKPGDVASPTGTAGASAHTGSRRAAVDVGTIRGLWRFRGYGRAELRWLLIGVVMRACELAADLAAPWPLALVINDLLQGRQHSSPLHGVAQWFGGSAIAMLGVAAVAVLVFTVASGVFDYLGDRFMNGAGERISSHIRADVFGRVERLPQEYHDHQSDRRADESGDHRHRAHRDQPDGPVLHAGARDSRAGGHGRGGGVGGLAARTDHLVRGPVGVLHRRPLRTADPGELASAPCCGGRSDRFRHRVAAGHPDRARVRQPGRGGPAVRVDERPRAEHRSARGRSQRTVHPGAGVGRGDRHRGAAVRRRLRGPARLVVGRAAGGGHQLPAEHPQADEAAGQAAADLHPGRRLGRADRRDPGPAPRTPRPRPGAARAGSRARSSCEASAWTTGEARCCAGWTCVSGRGSGSRCWATTVPASPPRSH